MERLLIVDDEPGIRMLLKDYFEMTGYETWTAENGREAVELAKKQPDLILLDIGLPDADGLSLMKQFDGIPVICVTAKGEVSNRVKGLMGGAEDYIVKPFALEELIARIQVVLRRNHKEQTLYRIGDTEIDLKSGIVKRNGAIVELASQEYGLLKTLLENKNIALSRSRLLDLAWGMDYEGEERTVDVHIRRLRQKLGMEESIKTIFKYGYRLEI